MSSEEPVEADSRICDQTVPENSNPPAKWARTTQRRFVLTAQSAGNKQPMLSSLWTQKKTAKGSKSAQIVDWKQRKRQRKDDDEDDFADTVSTSTSEASTSGGFRRVLKTASGAEIVKGAENSSKPLLLMSNGVYPGRKKSVNIQYPNSSKSGDYGQSDTGTGVERPFVAPKLPPKSDQNALCLQTANQKCTESNIDPRLRCLDPQLVELIENEVFIEGIKTSWADVCGLKEAKQLLTEIVVWPFLRPELFKGILAPPKGVLLFGPPGNGKTMIGKCVASECAAAFFNISASSLTSKWVGEGEKLVRTLFAVARTRAPAVIFIDEIDSLLSARSESEHESSRRIKTQFLVEMDGLATDADERLLVLAATNRPAELDEAARRRFTKRILIGLPEEESRLALITRLIRQQRHELTDTQLHMMAEKTQGYSGFDVHSVCKEAAMNAIRSVSLHIRTIDAAEIRPISLSDVESALRSVRPTVTDSDLQAYAEWNAQFGCCSLPPNTGATGGEDLANCEQKGTILTTTSSTDG